MKNYLVKTLMLLITLSMGIVVVWGFNLMPASLVGPNETPVIQKLKQEHKGENVVVLFKGFSTEGAESIATFEVVNLSDKSVKYWSFEEKGTMFHSVKFRNEELKQFWCGTGQREYELSPNDSIIMKKNSSFLFQNKYMEKGKFKVSFSLGVEKGEYEQFWSESFTIPKTVQKLIEDERGRLD